MITDLEQPYHAKSRKYMLTKRILEQSTQVTTMDRLFITPPYSEQNLQRQLQKIVSVLKYVNFKWPGMEIGPGYGELTEHW